MHWC